MKITTKTIINYLPFDSDYKLDLLEKYDSLPFDEKAKVSDMVWDLYSDLYKLRIQENYDKAIAEAEEKGEKIDKNFYGKVLEMTREEVGKQLISAGESGDLGEARRSMEKIIKEMKAAKMPLKQ